MAKVLVVDDSRLARAMLKDMLVKLGHQIVGEAEDAPQALESFKSLAPEMVTLDLILPSGNGVEVLKAIREINPYVKVIVVSASGQDALNKELMDLGAQAILRKPFTLDEFKVVVQKAFEK